MPIDQPEEKWFQKPGVFSPDQIIMPPTEALLSPAKSPACEPAKTDAGPQSDIIPGVLNLNDPRLLTLPPEKIYSKAFLTKPSGPIAIVIKSPAQTGGTGTPAAMRPKVAQNAAKIAAPGTQGVTKKVFNQGFELFPVNLAPRSLRSPGVDDKKVSSEPPPGDVNAPVQRTVCISSYVTPSENIALMAAAKRLHQRKGELLRRAYFGHQAPIIVPEVNETKWRELAPLAANLNQITTKMNTNLQNPDRADGDLRPILGELKELVIRLRADLRGDSVKKAENSHESKS